MKNAFTGYTYQKKVTDLFLAKMDAERKIEKLEIEVNGNHKFDDLIISLENNEYCIQIKDLEKVNLSFSEGNVSINGTKHPLSKKINIIFFKRIDRSPNCKILNFPAFLENNVYLISLSRFDIDYKIADIYKSNPFRKSEIDYRFSEFLDNRKWTIERIDLPSIEVFNTQLNDTININREIIEFDDILHIEGKPGVGKSHLVEFLQKKHPNNILYRFWVSSQDKDKNERLKYKEFISNFSKELTGTLIDIDETVVIEQIQTKRKIVIIDGLDHVKNYNPSEFEQFVIFINKLKESCKVIVLSRPLEKEFDWKKQQLTNWNKEQTTKILNELYYISEYEVVNQIYLITNGYPILVKYVAEDYKKNSRIPKLSKLNTINDYYEQIIKNEKGTLSLSLFLCSRSFFMESEISLFSGDELTPIINQFIKEHPYLFEGKLNRISLFHDSFTTYLKKQDIDYSAKQLKINKIVFQSIMNGEKRFLSRFSSFDLSFENKKEIVKKFSSIQVFKELMKDVIDFEAIQDFYKQIREELENLSANDLKVTDYYDLSLIINMVSRNHIFPINQFLYTYVKVLLFNNYSKEDITSSKYLFAMLYFVEKNNSALLYNLTSNDNLYIKRFIEDLEKEIQEENNYFIKQENSLTEKKVEELLNDKLRIFERLPALLVNFFLQNINPKYHDFKRSVKLYIENRETEAIGLFENVLRDNNIDEYYGTFALKSAKQNIFGLGKSKEKNDYINLELKKFILKYKELGSFDLRDEIHNYIRLSLHQKRKIDILSISVFWTKYHNSRDYSFSNVNKALKTFEHFNFIKPENSLNLIKSIQEISEKGYSNLLTDYSEQYLPQITKYSKLSESEECYKKGILKIEDTNFILKNNMKCYEIAGFENGYYSVLEDLELFKLFDKNSVKENIQLILFNAILGKVKNINSFCSLRYLTGSIPKLIKDYQTNAEFENIFKSFLIYINLSLFDLKYNEQKTE